MQIDTYTGGLFETNSFFIPTPIGGILIDAPEGSADWLQRKGLKVTTILITHAHIDHVADAAKIKAAHGCRVGYHPAGTQMLTEPGFFRKYGFPWDVEPVEADISVEETPSLVVEGIDFRTFYVPGHCPGSICYLAHNAKTLFAGDVLFAGGVGRWDLPGGDRDLLFQGIKEKLFALDEDVRVLPGHGPATTIGNERRGNPYVRM